MSSKAKWRESFQKARSQSQSSLDLKDKERKTSLLEEGDLSVSDDELEEYLGTLKKKSGVGRLWTGNTFDRVIDRTPDVSISSVSDGEAPNTQEQSNHGDGDFRPNLLDWSQATEDAENDNDVSEPSSIKPMQAVRMISDLELSEGPLELANNVKLTMSDKQTDNLHVARDIKSITNDFGKTADEPQTVDEVTEEIEEDLDLKNSDDASSSISIPLSSNDSDKHVQRSPSPKDHGSDNRSEHSSNKRDHRRDKSSQLSSRHSSHHQHRSASSRNSTRPSSRKSAHKEMSSKNSDYSYSSVFSESSNRSSRNDSQDSKSYTISNSSKSSAKEKSQRRRSSKHRNNISHHDVGIQVGAEDINKAQRHPAIGMATLGPSLGNRYVDPSPIAPHVVSADAVEALTAYNPAVVALTDMLRQQLKLVEQFVENSRRMYESYTSNLNTTYQYTTLEDTMKYIQQSEPHHRKKHTRRKTRRDPKEDD